VAGILVVFGASQLVGFVGNIGDNLPAASGAVAFETPTFDGQPASLGPNPAVEPSATTEPSGTPIPTFIPLPSQSANEPPLALPGTPSLALSSVGAHSIAIRWFDGAGGPAQKWEIWRKTGSSTTWIKLGELSAGTHSFGNGSLASGTKYTYRIRAVNTSGFSGYSNSITATTPAGPTPPPSPTASPTASPTETPTPPPAACADGLDNDADTWTDLLDPGCSDPLDNDESNVFACADLGDNDGDHLVDGEDPNCLGQFDDDESPQDIYECNDGFDNEVAPDGLIDFGQDPECSSWSDIDESS
jgi:hypothetical protein